jgi:hypothetical protein
MAQQDELANLFASSMNFSNPTPPPDEPQIKPEHFQPPPQEEPQRVYASTHYIPPTSFHANSTPQASPEPEPRPLSDNEIADLLIQNQIDPHTLFPSQVALFRHAGDEQRQRLLELWRISPPNLGAYDIQKEQSSWLETTLAREEEVARLRYERAVIESQGIGSPYQEQEISRPSSAPAATQVQAEPYMMSGYEALAQREYERGALEETKRYTQATDPVYAYHGNWKQNVQQMENNYGAFEAQRGGMGAMNGLDEEMVM